MTTQIVEVVQIEIIEIAMPESGIIADSSNNKIKYKDNDNNNLDKIASYSKKNKNNKYYQEVQQQ